eukprot:5837913-Amphidinium_carterae.1
MMCCCAHDWRLTVFMHAPSMAQDLRVLTVDTSIAYVVVTLCVSVDIASCAYGVLRLSLRCTCRAAFGRRKRKKEAPC